MRESERERWGNFCFFAFFFFLKFGFEDGEGGFIIQNFVLF